MGYTSHYRAKRAEEAEARRAKRLGPADYFAICTQAALCASAARQGAWTDALRYGNRALKAGLNRAPRRILDDVYQSLVRMADWYGAEAVLLEVDDISPGIPDGPAEYARPGELGFIVDTWAAVEAMSWRPDEDEVGRPEATAALAAGQALNREPRNREQLAAFRKHRRALLERTKEGGV